MSDEGVGIHVMRMLSQRASGFPDVEFLDLGTAANRVLHAIPGRRKVVFIDCAFMGEDPGAIRRFTPDDVLTAKLGPGVSLHEGDLLKTIELSRTLGECPEKIVIFGIQPAETSYSEYVSPVLADRMEQYVKMVTRELNKV